MTTPAVPDDVTTVQQAVDRARLHAVMYRESASRQHHQANGFLTQDPPDYWSAATACHRALQFTRQAEACETLTREMAS